MSALGQLHRYPSPWPTGAEAAHVQQSAVARLCLYALQRPISQRQSQAGLASSAESPRQSEAATAHLSSKVARAALCSAAVDASTSGDNFCIIESRESLKDFAKLQLTDINQAIQNRRNRVFLLLEEVRRLRVQQRLKGGEKSKEEELQEERYPSVVPLLPPLTDKTISMYLRFYLSALGLIIVFGGLLAPTLEVKLGVGGTSYAEFIRMAHLPAQLAEVDPIVASFCGGAVGVLSTLMLVEANNSKMQAAHRCIYCGGAGYSTCGTCGGLGAVPQQSATAAQESSASQNGTDFWKRAMASGDRERCGSCSGTGKVMCTACLCTGKKVAREHDPRLDPFS